MGLDEEALAHSFDRLRRKEGGIYYTPAPLAERVLELAAEAAPPGRPLVVIDPACGAGAFLDAASRRFPQARLLGLELTSEGAAQCRARVPRARVLEGDGLGAGMVDLCALIPDDAFELWVGNPPYNGTSPLLADKRRYAEVRALLGAALPRGTSLRDDFAFFLLSVAARLRQRAGVLAFLTPSTLLDSYLYAPLRAQLLEALELREVLELGSGAFANTRVRTCATVFRSPREFQRPARYQTRPGAGPFEPSQLSPPLSFLPSGPTQVLRPSDPKAQQLDQRWREEGEPLSVLFPVTFPGLKTRFDELLVGDDAEVLLARVAAFCELPASQLDVFADEHRIPPRCLGKLRALKAALPAGFAARLECVRPFWRYAGAKHRAQIPRSARAYCYLHRALIPRGDHRLRGAYDPHLGPAKLVFNARELPLSAAVLEEEGCVHDHRHARFAPLQVPAKIHERGLAVATRGGDLGPLVDNLSPRGSAWARDHGGALALFHAVCAFINSAAVQQVWGPQFGAHSELWVPLDQLLPGRGDSTIRSPGSTGVIGSRNEP